MELESPPQLGSPPQFGSLSQLDGLTQLDELPLADAPLAALLLYAPTLAALTPLGGATLSHPQQNARPPRTMTSQLVLPANAQPPSAILSQIVPSTIGPSAATGDKRTQLAEKPLTTLPPAVPSIETPSVGEPVPALLADTPLTAWPIAAPTAVMPSAVKPIYLRQHSRHCRWTL